MEDSNLNSNQPQSNIIQKYYQKPIISFAKIEKQQPTRKNIKNQLIWWDLLQTDDYQFCKYLEQNRYSRLFQEIEVVGKGGFGRVYKAQHILDQRIYAIKKIKIHLGMNEDFKQHCVYREIIAISQVMHKNVVRYHACWIENVTPNEKKINRAIKIIESNIKSKFKNRRAQAKKLELQISKNSVTDDSMIDLEQLKLSSFNKNTNQKPGMKPSILNINEDKKELLGKKWIGKNLLRIIEDDSEMQMNEDWANQNENSFDQSESSSINIIQNSKQQSDASQQSSSSKSKSKQRPSKQIQSSSSSSSSSENSPDEESEEEEEGEDESSEINSQSSLYNLIENGKDFMTLNVMIQMECCSDVTLREYLDDKNYQVNRKIVFHLFKQLISGLRHIHEEGLIHRDIKPANIFIDKNRMLLKIGDFGLAKKSNYLPQFEQQIKGLKKNNLSLVDLNKLNQVNIIKSKEQYQKSKLRASLIGCKQQSVQNKIKQFDLSNQNVKNKLKEEASICAGTPLYQAPEQTMQQIQISKKANEPIWLTDKVDMFAAGLTLYEMCSNFKTQHQRIQKFHQLKTLRQCDESFNNMPEERDIILNLTDPNPKKRSSAVYLLNSKTFQTWAFEVKQ